ncbi:TlpA family protein disulfide reductase [Arhodomonas aquaeolei]|nr:MULTISPECIES: TlpA disulfide reductase family protein [Arhodomonas]MCS4504321.1 TlpA family protein disulfide reductase [Arhodomonas aquaeolei]
MRRTIYIALAVLLGVAIGAGGLVWYQQRQPEMRPVFSLPGLDGERHAITEWDGQVIVLNFWASWCPPCREEIPLFNELQSRFGDVRFLGVAVDRLDAVRRFMDEQPLKYPTLHGLGMAMDVQARYGNDAGTLPYTVVIDREGRIRHIFARQVHRGELAPILEELSGGG